MIADKFDTRPAQLLLDEHRKHNSPYIQEFKGMQLVIFPEVFNPAYTKVTLFFAENLIHIQDSEVLEMFSGSGALSFLVAEKARRVIGVDISPQSVECANVNAVRLGLAHKTEFRTANLWEGVNDNEKFDLIIGNPPLLPALPEDLLEMAIADGPQMLTTKGFLNGCVLHMKNDESRVLMAFSNACSGYFDSPLNFIGDIANKSGLTMKVKSELDVGYEIYRILEFKKRNIWPK